MVGRFELPQCVQKVYFLSLGPKLTVSKIDVFVVSGQNYDLLNVLNVWMRERERLYHPEA